MILMTGAKISPGCRLDPRIEAVKAGGKETDRSLLTLLHVEAV
jgi:hypothetical protein